MASEKQYCERDVMALDRAGGYYARHIQAMTTEGLESKSDIAAELGWRDMQIDNLALRRDALEKKLAAVVAENTKMRNAIEFATAPNMWIEQHDGMLEYRYVDWYVDVLNDTVKEPPPYSI
ncbi:hypothetical protein [Yersinia enterocolitica]